MILFPAIDLYNKQVVRLTKGAFDSVKTYDNDPVGIAKKFEQEGASWLHIIDLNGANNGNPINQTVIKNIINQTNLKVQVGGGIRRVETIRQYVSLGVTRVILGSFAVKNKNLLPSIVKEFGNKVIVSIDSKKGMVTYSGWKDISSYTTLDFAKEVEAVGIKTIVYTDIDKDGMLEGTDIQTILQIQKRTSLQVIASGGVTTKEDIKALQRMNTYGAIIGKALYEKKLDFKEVVQCLQEE